MRLPESVFGLAFLCGMGFLILIALICALIIFFS